MCFLLLFVCTCTSNVKFCHIGLCPLLSLTVTVYVLLFAAFNEDEAGEISLQLEQYLKSIATTGQTLYALLNLAKIWFTNLTCVIVHAIKLVTRHLPNKLTDIDSQTSYAYNLHYSDMNIPITYVTMLKIMQIFTGISYYTVPSVL